MKPHADAPGDCPLRPQHRRAGVLGRPGLGRPCRCWLASGDCRGGQLLGAAPRRFAPSWRFMSPAGRGTNVWLVQCPSCAHESRPGAKFCDACGAALPREYRPLRAGEPVAVGGGRYRVERLLGAGAHKRVYLARDTTLDREVALALLRAAGLAAVRAERVRREALAMGRLASHPNVVTVYDAGEEGGCPYIVEEYVSGGTVADLLAQTPGRPLPIDRALRIAADVCAALDYAHRHGMVHRDLKPANVWLDPSGAAKLGDFGLVAALRHSGTTLARLTEEGGLLGTLAYIAPEQALGRAADPRADLYSFGVMLYELVTGRVPFAADDALAIISQHLRTPPVAPAWHNAEVPKALDGLIVRLLAKDSRDRPKDAAEVGAALEALKRAPTARRAQTAERAANPLDRLAGGVHVGREREVEDLCAAADLAFAGRGQLVLVFGDAGIGKTRLAEELATYAHLRDALVLWGRCYEGEGAPPYWPWVQIVRAYAVDHDPEVLAAAMGAGAADIAQIVSEVGRRLPNLQPPPALTAEQARFRLFDSVTTFLIDASRREPLVLVLDDLHCADPPSLLLLEFLARVLLDARLLVVGTYRDTEVGPRHPLTHTLGELARAHPPRRIVLGGLTRSEVGRYIAMTAGVDPNAALLDAVHHKTEGNPLFLGEVVRLLSAEGRLERFGEQHAWDVTIPPEVREVLARRLERLSEPCRAVVSLAAVIGGEFHLPVLQAVADLPPERVLDALDEAEAARVLTAIAPGRYRFAHGVVADALAESVPAGPRVELHRQVGLALEKLFVDRLELHLAELAHHFLEAAPAGELDKGLRYATAAAERAAGRLAYEDAAQLYERALHALELTGTDGARRCDLLLALGDAYARAGSVHPARGAFRRAAGYARRLCSSERLAQAALGFGGPRATYGIVDEKVVALLEEALATLGASDDRLRARLLSRLAMELYFAGALERRAALAEEALTTARRVGEPATLAYALGARDTALWGPEGVEERLAIAGEVLELAARAGDPEQALEGHARRAVALIQLGDLAGARTDMSSHSRLARELRHPFGLWRELVWQAMQASLAGRFEEALVRAKEAFERGRRVRAPEAENCYVGQALLATISLGRPSELQSTLEDMIERYPAVKWALGRCRLHAELGHREEAALAFEQIAVAGFTKIERNMMWLVALTALADVCAFLGDAPRAAELEQLMRPYAGRIVLSGEAWSCYGAADRPLGLLAATRRRWDEAETYFRHAVERNTTLGSPPWLAQTQLEYAQMLLKRGGPGDAELANDLLAKASSTAEQLGMLSLAARAHGQLTPNRS
jgi:tetratricopeptide (TPR) repeat protein